ncbi:MAG: hypothetical protein EX271_08065 [Acidimicrobiales bacterium]|nr:hypothetical protein [Hyphomonadaceae bacterium]RZV41416.1 MAG: hypothetical protein EX271_08065 [Acidimicrobiales bacterium]
MRAQHIKITLLTICMMATPVSASEAPLFQSDQMLNVVLTAPLSQAYSERKKEDRLWMQGQFAYKTSDGTTYRTPVSVRTRGVFRRLNCKLPPLRLNFKKKQVAGTLFEGQDKLKLVAPCATDKQSQQDIVLEYLAYKSLEILTNDALKSRLMRVSYVDSDGKRKPWTHIGFVIEDDKNMARRMGMEVVTAPHINRSQLDVKKTALVELFQLMIGNTDYSTIRSPAGKDCCHNIELMKAESASSKITPIPYDFDSAGIVNAKYAKPPDHLPISNVRRRYFTGRCRTPEIWAANFALFNGKRTEIVSLFANSPHLDERNKKSSVDYMNAFFDMLSDKKKRDRQVIGKCRE